MTEVENVRSRIPGSSEWRQEAGGYWMYAVQLDVCAMAQVLKDLEFRLITMTGLLAADGETRVIYHYVRGGLELNLSTLSQGQRLPSISSIAKPASWAEREVHDFFGLVFEGHPNLAPLLRPNNLEPGFFREPAATAG
jgi:NADH-quinone oxidoreductase subunit C